MVWPTAWPTARPTVRPTVAADWAVLKALRLTALRDAPTAFGVSHAEALKDSDGRWQARAAGDGPASFFLAWSGGEAVGMAAALCMADGRASLIAMWVSPRWRGAAAAAAAVGGDGAADPNAPEHKKASAAARKDASAVAAHASQSTSLSGAAATPPKAGDATQDRVADLLIYAVKQHARAMAAAELLLEVAPSNRRAVAFYQRHGFRFQPHVERLASHPDIVVQRMGCSLAGGGA